MLFVCLCFILCVDIFLKNLLIIWFWFRLLSVYWGRHHLQHTRIPCWVKREHHLHRFTWRVSECDKAIQYRFTFVTHHLCDIICSMRVTLEPKKTIRKWRVKKQTRTVFKETFSLYWTKTTIFLSVILLVQECTAPGTIFFYQQRQQATGQFRQQRRCITISATILYHCHSRIIRFLRISGLPYHSQMNRSNEQGQLNKDHWHLNA